ncbi:MAG: glycosyltransferase [Candidatus Micrarchaeia archaeon]
MKGMIFSEGNGYGHVARDFPISELLGIPIMTFGMGAEYLKMRKKEFIEIPSPYKIETKGKTKIVANLRQIMRFFNPSITSDIIKRFQEVDFVIVDGSPIGLILAKIAGKKTIMITNDTSSLVGVNGIQRPIANELNQLILSYPEKILVPDFPPPFTVAKYNLMESENIKMIGPLVENVKQIKHDKDCLVITTNEMIDKKLKKYLGKNAIYSSEVGNVKPYYESCKIVICHGGHTTITEALSYGKPIIAIYDKSYSERSNHIKFIEEMGIGYGIEEKAFEAEYLRFLPEIIDSFDKGKLTIYKKIKDRLNPINEIRKSINQLKL